MVPDPTTHSPRARARRRRLAWAGLLVAAWAISLGPIVHALLHERPHRHLADGSIAFDEAELHESTVHVHADGSVHGDAGAPVVPVPTTGEPGHDHPTDAPAPPERHGASSLAHFGAAFLSAPPYIAPLRPVDAALPGRPEIASSYRPRARPTPIQPRAPPSV